jgi:hypothetical protein
MISCSLSPGAARLNITASWCAIASVWASPVNLCAGPLSQSTGRGQSAIVTAMELADWPLATAVPFGIWPTFRDGYGSRPVGHLCWAVSRTRLRSSGSPARPNICLLIILMWLTRPSTGPEFQRLVRPWVTASRSCSRPLAKDDMPGSSAARTSLIHCGRSWPVSWVSMVANARTWPQAAWSSGQRSRTALSRGCSSSVRESGWRVSQPVTSRTLGGGGSSGAAAGRCWSR